MMVPPYTEAGKCATIKYQAKMYDKITLMVPKGQRAEIKAHAEKMRESSAEFIRRAIAETIERDNEK